MTYNEMKEYFERLDIWYICGEYFEKFNKTCGYWISTRYTDYDFDKNGKIEDIFKYL